jgi:hypothetical protein
MRGVELSVEQRATRNLGLFSLPHASPATHQSTFDCDSSDAWPMFDVSFVIVVVSIGDLVLRVLSQGSHSLPLAYISALCASGFLMGLRCSCGIPLLFGIEHLFATSPSNQRISSGSLVERTGGSYCPGVQTGLGYCRYPAVMGVELGVSPRGLGGWMGRAVGSFWGPLEALLVHVVALLARFVKVLSAPSPHGRRCPPGACG